MADARLGANRNVNTEVDHSIVAINSVTATTIAVSRLKRMTFSACLEPGIFDVNVFIRYYPAATDNIKQGRDVLTRYTAGNDNLFRPLHEMLPDNVYSGEISAICDAGTVNLLIAES